MPEPEQTDGSGALTLLLPLFLGASAPTSDQRVVLDFRMRPKLL